MKMIHALAQELLNGAGVRLPTSSVEIKTTDPILKTKTRAAEVSAAALTAQATLINQIWKMRTGREQKAAFDLQGASLAMQSVFYQRLWKYAVALPEASYPTVNLFETSDKRWVMLDGGYPQIRDGYLNLLNCPNNADAIAAAVRTWEAAGLEQACADKKLPGAMVRSYAEWLSTEQGKVLAAAPPVELVKIGDAPIEGFPRSGSVYPPHGVRPLSGLRVLDMTHVIAGPTCGKVLACEGATPLHIYSPYRPQLPAFDYDTGHGKLSAFLDVTQQEDHDRLLQLARTADVFAQSYRPGAISGRFPPEKMAELRPGIIYVSVSCYGFDGPWKDRPGWEQLAQSAVGIADLEGAPGAPKLTEMFYPNDYTTGNLAALGVLAALVRRATEGGSWHVRVSLSRTAMLIMQQGIAAASAADPKVPAEVLQRFMMEGDTRMGRLHFLGPVVRYSESLSGWDLPAAPLGVDPPEWPFWLNHWQSDVAR